MLRDGSISNKAWGKARLSVLRGTKSQPSKMANFDSKEKNEGGARGVIKAKHNNDSMTQGTRREHMGAERMGGKQRKGQPRHHHINRAQGPLNPSGTGQTGRSTKEASDNTAMKGARVQPSGPLYGGPNSRP